MYCIKCGIELSEGQEICPVCQTKVYHPDLPVGTLKPTYPQKEFASEEFNPRGVLFVITIFMVLVLALPMLFEILWHDSVDWSGYVAGGVILFYGIFILPFWFRNPNPAVFVPSVFGGILLFLLYINWQTEGAWFLSFAFPITGALGGIVTALSVLTRYIRRGYLYIYGGGLIALGGWTVLLEFLLRLTFQARYPVYWSPMSCVFLVALGLMLIVIAIVKPLRDSLRKIFYIG